MTDDVREHPAWGGASEDGSRGAFSSLLAHSKPRPAYAN